MPGEDAGKGTTRGQWPSGVPVLLGTESFNNRPAAGRLGFAAGSAIVMLLVRLGEGRSLSDLAMERLLELGGLAAFGLAFLVAAWWVAGQGIVVSPVDLTSRTRLRSLQTVWAGVLRLEVKSAYGQRRYWVTTPDLVIRFSSSWPHAEHLASLIAKRSRRKWEEVEERR